MIKHHSNLVTVLGHPGLASWGQRGSGGGRESQRGGGKIGKAQVEREQGAPSEIVLPYRFPTTL